MYIVALLDSHTLRTERLLGPFDNKYYAEKYAERVSDRIRLLGYFGDVHFVTSVRRLRMDSIDGVAEWVQGQCDLAADL